MSPSAGSPHSYIHDNKQEPGCELHGVEKATHGNNHKLRYLPCHTLLPLRCPVLGRSVEQLGRGLHHLCLWVESLVLIRNLRLDTLERSCVIFGKSWPVKNVSNPRLSGSLELVQAFDLAGVRVKQRVTMVVSHGRRLVYLLSTVDEVRAITFGDSGWELLT